MGWLISNLDALALIVFGAMLLWWSSPRQKRKRADKALVERAEYVQQHWKRSLQTVIDKDRGKFYGWAMDLSPVKEYWLRNNYVRAGRPLSASTSVGLTGRQSGSGSWYYVTEAGYEAADRPTPKDLAEGES